MSLSDVLPALDDAFAQLQALCADEGIIIEPTGEAGDTLRTAADTAADVAYRKADYANYVAGLAPGQTPTSIEQWRPIARFGSSYHNYGGAVDAHPVQWPSSMTRAQASARMQQLAPQAGLRSGASFGDPPHLELPIPLAQVKADWEALGGKAGVAPLVLAGAIAGLAALAAAVWYLWRAKPRPAVS